MRLFGKRSVLIVAAVILAAGLLTFGASIFMNVEGGPECGQGSALVGASGVLLTLCGALLLTFAWAVAKQAGWVALAGFFAMDLWILFGMLMMHLEGMPKAPDPMLMLAFVVHAACMYLTTVWAYHARNLSTLAQIRAGEAGRSIGAVWIFLAAYIMESFFDNEASPFDSAAGAAVLSALTLSALALTMGSGYTKYREVMAERAGVESAPMPRDSADDPVSPAVDVHRVTAQKGDQRQTGLRGQVDRE
jgi:hypothetical protein